MRKLFIIYILFFGTLFADHNHNHEHIHSDNSVIEKAIVENQEKKTDILKEIEDIQNENKAIEEKLQEALKTKTTETKFTTENIIENYGILNVDTDIVIDSANLIEKHPLASLTKVMTAIVVLDEVEKGKISLNDKIRMKKEFTKIGGSRLATAVGLTYTVEELLQALLVYSANNAAYALADYISKGSMFEFIYKMNQKAYSLGMHDTIYHTPSGLPTTMTGVELDVSTVKDQMILAEYAMTIPKIMEIANLEEITLKSNYRDSLVYNNRNKILHQEGNIGLKTGYHSLAGYNMIGIYEDEGLKTIIITLGNATEQERFDRQLELHNKFKEQLEKVIDKDTFKARLEVKNKLDDFVELYINQDFYFIKKEKLKLIIKLNKNSYTTLQKDEEVGKLLIQYKDKIVGEIPLFAKTEIPRINQ